MKNPNEQLEQLRRLSLVEFEHLKKDEHPNPPLRALPEHSVLTEADTRSHVPLREGASSYGGGSLEEATSKSQQSSAPSASLGKHSSTEHHSLGRVSKGVSTDDQLKGQQTALREPVGDNPIEQPPAPFLDTSQTPEARGIAGHDFASASKRENTSQGPLTSEGFFANPSTRSTKDSFTEQNLSNQTVEKSSSSAPQQRPLSSNQQVQAGQTTFKLPDFGTGSSSDGRVSGDEVLSPTQPGGEDDDRKGQGLF